MAVFELILCIIAAVVVSSFVSRFVPKVSTPLVQIVLGVLVTYLPFFPDATLDPELFMVLFMFVKIPSPVPETNLQIAYGVSGFFAALFGSLSIVEISRLCS